MFKKKKQAQQEQQPVPRTIEEITKDFTNLCAQAGNTRYQIYVHEQELERLNKLMASLNYEADARKKLDTATSPEAPKEAEQPVSGAV